MDVKGVELGSAEHCAASWKFWSIYSLFFFTSCLSLCLFEKISLTSTEEKHTFGKMLRTLHFLPEGSFVNDLLLNNGSTYCGISRRRERQDVKEMGKSCG